VSSPLAACGWDTKVIIVSHSGRTKELLPLPDMFRKAGCGVMAIVGDGRSPLSKNSDLVRCGTGFWAPCCEIGTIDTVLRWLFAADAEVLSFIRQSLHLRKTRPIVPCRPEVSSCRFVDAGTGQRQPKEASSSGA
jgi:hypothetical protein